MLAWLQRLFSSTDDKPAKPAPAARPVSAPAPQPKPGAAPAASVLQPAPSATVSKPGGGSTFLERSEVNGAFTNWMFEGNQYTDLFTNQLENEILAAIDKIVKSNQSGAALVRRMPGVIPQLLQSLRTENFSGADLAKKLSHDVVLVGAVIRLANSSFYNPAQSITSIEHAILVLGQTGLRQLITSVAFQPIIDLNSGHFTKLVAPRIWEQSEKCAVASRMLATVHQADPFEAFLAGLVQYVGLIASLRVIDQMSDGKQSIGSESFCNALLNYGRILSCSIGKEWHFPNAVVKAVEDQGLNIKNAASMSPMGKVLGAGDHVSKLHMLTRDDALYGEQERFVKKLSPQEAECLAYLDSLQEGQI